MLTAIKILKNNKSRKTSTYHLLIVTTLIKSDLLVQQGSVMYTLLLLLVEDPLSQCYATTKNATRITYKEATRINSVSTHLLAMMHWPC